MMVQFPVCGGAWPWARSDTCAQWRKIFKGQVACHRFCVVPLVDRCTETGVATKATVEPCHARKMSRASFLHNVSAVAGMTAIEERRSTFSRGTGLPARCVYQKKLPYCCCVRNANI